MFPFDAFLCCGKPCQGRPRQSMQSRQATPKYFVFTYDTHTYKLQMHEGMNKWTLPICRGGAANKKYTLSAFFESAKNPHEPKPQQACCKV